MPRELSIEIKHRFIKAVEAVAKEKYPQSKEIDIIKAVGMQPTNYYKMRVEENRYPTLDNCSLLCNLYGISATWLLMSKGPMRETNKHTEPMEMIKIAMKELELKLKPKKR